MASLVRGAVLATQAMELLGGRTPTASVGALALRHEFEILAECRFVGVEYHLSLRDRFKDIETNLASFAFWLNRGRRKAFELNSMAALVARLLSVLRAHGAFEESEACQVKLRTLHRTISLGGGRGAGSWLLRRVLWPFVWYGHSVVRSPLCFCMGFTAMLLGFTLAFWRAGVPTLSESWHATLLAFFTVSLPNPFPDLGHPEIAPASVAVTVVGYFASAAGLLNLGLLVSYLYNMIRRG